MAKNRRSRNSDNKAIDGFVLVCTAILLLMLLQGHGAIACDVTELDLWIGEDTAEAESYNTDAVYECPDGSFGWYLEWDAGDATTPDFEGTINIGSTELDSFTADGADMTASGSADLTGISTGEHTVEAWIRRDGGEWCESTNGRTLKVVELVSLEADPGCVNETVTFTLTTDPDLGSYSGFIWSTDGEDDVTTDKTHEQSWASVGTKTMSVSLGPKQARFFRVRCGGVDGYFRIHFSHSGRVAG